MPTRKIADIKEDKVCRDPDHNPPMFMVYPPGYYVHTCPRCGKVQKFTVQGPTL